MSRSDTPSGNQPLRVLVIGAGPAARDLHLPVLARLRDRGEIALACVCDLDDRRASAAQQGFGFARRVGDPLPELARDDVDAVYIFGSAQMHHGLGMAALRQGKHLFVEKPIAPSFAEAEALARAVRERGLTAVGGHNRRFHPAVTAVRARAGQAGWRFAEAVFHKAEAGRPPPFGAATWLTGNAIHALDVLIFVMGGLPEQMTATAAAEGSDSPNVFSALMRWPDGAQGVFLSDNAAGGRCETYGFHAPGETCRIGDGGLEVERDGVAFRPDSAPIRSGDVEAEHLAFLEAIRSGAPPIHAIGALAPSLFLAELIEGGHAGPVRLPNPVLLPPPRTPYTLARRPTARSAESTSLLVVEPAPLLTALARHAPNLRLVSPDDVLSGPGARPDVRAAILGRGAPALSDALLQRLPHLGVVGVMGLSLDRHEPEALLRRGIELVNARDAYADTVAEFALGLAILGRRGAFRSHEAMRRGGWGMEAPGWRSSLRRAGESVRPLVVMAGLEPLALRLWRRSGGSGAPPASSRDLRGARAGLIGWGANARTFADRLRQAGVGVQVHSVHATAADLAEVGASYASMGEALSADIVSLHRGLTDRTFHCLGAGELDRLKPGAVLINVARGGLMDTEALVARLRRGDIFACLDTFETEPLPASHSLRRLPNVFLTSHIAGGSPQMHAAAAEEVVRKVTAWLDGDRSAAIAPERLRAMT